MYKFMRENDDTQCLYSYTQASGDSPDDTPAKGNSS
jgi:hypothetical protein